MDFISSTPPSSLAILKLHCYLIHYPCYASQTPALSRLYTSRAQATQTQDLSKSATSKDPSQGPRKAGHYPDGTTLIKEVERALAFDQGQKLADRKEACKYWAEARFLEIVPPKPDCKFPFVLKI